MLNVFEKKSAATVNPVSGTEKIYKRKEFPLSNGTFH